MVLIHFLSVTSGSRNRMKKTSSKRHGQNLTSDRIWGEMETWMLMIMWMSPSSGQKKKRGGGGISNINSKILGQRVSFQTFWNALEIHTALYCFWSKMISFNVNKNGFDHLVLRKGEKLELTCQTYSVAMSRMAVVFDITWYFWLMGQGFHRAFEKSWKRVAW